jgi:hypothetical protein
LDLLVNSHLTLIEVVQFLGGGKTDPAFDQFGDLPRAQVRGHDDQRARKIDAPVITQRQGRLVEDAEQQPP